MAIRINNSICLTDIKAIIRADINAASNSFVSIGYHLKYVRDNQLFTEDDYFDIWEFAQAEFGIGKSSASRFMNINDRFSVDGNSVNMLEQYQGFGSSKLTEMLSMTDEQIGKIIVTTTRSEIREMKKPIKEVVAPALKAIDVNEPPTGNCIHRPDHPCTLPESSKIATLDGENCNASCCWSCKKRGNCGYECNSSLHRPDVEVEPEKDIMDEIEEVETVKADIIETECIRTDIGKEDGIREIVRITPTRNEDDADCPAGIGPGRDGCNRTFSGERYDDANCICKTCWTEYLKRIINEDRDRKDPIEIESPKIKQPELSILKNNDQRKEFIEAFETWPIWIDQKETGERYYRYNLTDLVALVIKVSLKHSYKNYNETKEYEYDAEQYYLVGIKYEYGLKGSSFKIDAARTFYECGTNKSSLIDYLKEFQKK